MILTVELKSEDDSGRSDAENTSNVCWKTRSERVDESDGGETANKLHWFWFLWT